MNFKNTFKALIMAAVLPSTLLAEPAERGSGTRGGGEVVYINGQMRFRDLVDKSVFECYPGGTDYISSHLGFQKLMNAFHEVNPYAATVFSMEAANNMAVCFVDVPLRYVNTEDRCAPYQSSTTYSKVLGVRHQGSNVLLVNRSLFNELNRRSQDSLDVGAFFVHEVARSFIPYTSEGNCLNNTDVRNFTGLVVRNSQKRLSTARFNGEMEIYGINLPKTAMDAQGAMAVGTIHDRNASHVERVKAAIELKNSGLKLERIDIMKINELLQRPDYQLSVAVVNADLEMVEVFAKNFGIQITVMEGTKNPLTLAVLSKNEALLELVEFYSKSEVKSQALHQLMTYGTFADVEVALRDGYINKDDFAYNLQAVISYTQNIKKLKTASEALNYLISQDLIQSNTELYLFAVTNNYVQSLELIIKKGEIADTAINLRNAVGETLMVRAIKNNDMKIFRSLLSATSFDPRITDNGGDNYLHIAVTFSRNEMIKELAAKYPVLKTMKNKARRTPADLAQVQQNTTAYKLVK